MFNKATIESSLTSVTSANAITALVLHQKGEQTLVTQHDINKNDELGLGRLVSFESAARVFDKTKSNQLKMSVNIIPENVIIEDMNILAWVAKSKEKTMWFRSYSMIKQYKVTWCNLLFVVNKKTRSLYVFSIASKSRPTLKTKIYHAPLMNIDENGLVCQGSAYLPKKLSIDTISEIEATIYDSQFTHLNTRNITGKNDIYTDNDAHLNFYKQKEKTGEKIFAHEMKALNTFEKVITKLKRNL